MTRPEAGPGAVVPREVRGLSLVSFLNDFSSEMVYPLLPAFVTRVLGGGALTLGALDGAADLTASVLRWFSGRLADRPGWSRRLITTGYGLAVLVRPLVALAGAAWQVVALRVLDRLGKGLRSPARDALIARLTEPRVRGRAFGFNRAADHLGAVAGSLLAWVLLARDTDVRGVILASAVPGVLAMLILVPVLARADRRVESGRDAVPEAPAAGAGSPADVTGARFWGPVFALTLLTVARLPETLLLLRLQDLGVAVSLVPLVWAGLHVVRTLASYPGGWLSDRFGPRAMLGGAGLIFAAVSLILARTDAPAPAVGAFLVLGIVAGLSEPGERSVVARLAPAKTGRGFGSAQSLAGILALPAGLLFGFMYQQRGAATALLGSAVVLTIAVMLWILLTGRSVKAEWVG